MSDSSMVEKRRPAPAPTGMKIVGAFITLLAGTGAIMGTKSVYQGSRNEESIKTVETATIERVQRLSENHAATNANIEGLRRDICRIEAQQTVQNTKIDKTSEVLNAKLDRLIERGTR